MTAKTRNPATGEIIKTYDLMSQKEVDAILQKVALAQKQWKETSVDHRAQHMRSVIEVLKKNRDQYAKIISTEMGKPITAAAAEVEKCQWVCEYYATHATSQLAPRLVETNLKKNYVAYRPLGIILAIMPWNYPFWQVFRFAAPNLMAGNACVLKHAEISTGASLAIESLFREAGLPDNLFRSLIVDNEGAQSVIEHPLVAGVTLTGSERAGRSVAKTAGDALKKVVLELGGSDPYVVLSDADLELAATQILKSRLNNSGQVCISAKRVIIESPVYDQLCDLIKTKIKEYTYGDPLQSDTKLGPLARADLRDTVQEQVEASIKAGAKLICGGKIPEGAGFYYPPTLLIDVTPGMVAFDDEIFGPVVTLCRAKDENDAIELANKTRYGLSGVIFTRNIEKGEYLAREKINVGTCFVNGMVSSDPRLPFGGIKSSGFGRELSVEGISEFVNIKTIGVVE